MSLDTTTVKIRLKGQQIPIRLAPDGAIEFYGTRKRGDSTYLDFYTDTSAYWLLWQDPSPGLRFTPVPDLGLSPGRIVQATRTVVHVEENTDYYEGTGEAEITQTGPVAGEGWAWSYFYPNTSSTFPFTLDQPAVPASDSAVITVRLFSTTLPRSTPDHIARFWINDSLTGEVQFAGRTQGAFRAAFPSSWLKDGANAIRIMSIPTLSAPNQFYLDWFEIEYTRQHVARDGQLLCTVLPNLGSPAGRITATGFPDAAIGVYDLTRSRRLSGTTVTGDAGSGYAVAFDDTISEARRYLMVSDGSASAVPQVTRKTFTGLREFSGGADYIIITHGNFRAAANTLAAHRAAFNGVRTAVIDIQDIYDEFNYGHLASEPVKMFLRYAYDHWPTPAPAYVLMFGDASWDYHRYMSTTTMTNYVPAYGVPAGDNWYVCFDSVYAFLPMLSIGRLPAQDPIQAERLVAKVIAYDTAPLAEWNKNFLFITGGSTDAEKSQFNSQSESMIREIVLPGPIGGTPFRVYKTTPNTIDGENKELLHSLVRDGLIFMNYLGHSGGRIWGVDIGPPSDLQNTNGMLPFVTSVSCNVGAFAEPSNNVLAEDFVLADNRAAIAMWASSSLGYTSVGTALVQSFLELVRVDTLRLLGDITNASRIKLWQTGGSGFVTIASMNLNPLLGDPLTALAIPRKPDLAIFPADLSLDVSTPTPLDTNARVRVVVHNYGLVPRDSVTLALVDDMPVARDSILQNGRIRPTLHRDTVMVPWKSVSRPGPHQLLAVLDPLNAIDEVTKANNQATSSVYVYLNTMLAVRPLINQVVRAGSATLVVTLPAGTDSAAAVVHFELDTSAAFLSPVLVRSGPVPLGPVGSRWVTPPLASNTHYYWRARSTIDTLVGRWVEGAVTVGSDLPPQPMIRWSEATPQQFCADQLSNIAVSDTGLTLRKTPSSLLAARSVGDRANADKDFYSTIRVNGQTITGLWWEHGYSFMAVRLDAFSGIFDFKAFNVSGNAALSDSMLAFINATPAGSYVVVTVIYDGYSNVTSALRSAIRGLGSARIDSVRPGHSWMLIARKGSPSSSLLAEQWSPAGIAQDSTIVPNNFSVGTGDALGPCLPYPQDFGTFRWVTSVIPGKTTVQGMLLGLRASGVADTLARVSDAEFEKDLSALGHQYGDSAYTAFRVGARFVTQDAVYSPAIKSWSLDIIPPPDLAISSRTVGYPEGSLSKAAEVGLPVTVHNIGYRTADSARITVSGVGLGGTLTPLITVSVDSISVDSSRTVMIAVPTAGLEGRNLLEVAVSPPRGGRDLIAGNNTARTILNFTSIAEPLEATLQLFADDVQLMDGDYVSNQPRLLVRLVNVSGVRPGQERVAVFVDSSPVQPDGSATAQNVAAGGAGAKDELLFVPRLKDGLHEFMVRLYRWNGAAGTDSLQRRISVNVLSETKILKLFNYPNPFADRTAFTFVLTGQRPPDDLTIRIFTITGRKIREITVPQGMVQVGFNSIPWDGRDNDGDEIANGYYFYQLQTRGDGKIVSGIEKLVKLR
jgi:hypothetical protein